MPLQVLVGSEEQEVTPESVLDPMYKDGNFFEGDLAIRKELIESYYGSDDASVSFTTIMCCFEAFIHRRVCFKSMDTAVFLCLNLYTHALFPLHLPMK